MNKRQHILIILLFTLLGMSLQAQEKPPRPVEVTTIQSLSFGAFYPGDLGGTVIVYPDGSRSTTGDVILVSMGFFYFPAIFDIDAEPGTLINILKGPPVVLTGSEGGSLTLTIGDSDPSSPFIISPANTQLRVGGILQLGNIVSNPPGTYNGNFMITFIQE